MALMKLVYAILLTIAPITELRVGLPLAINFALEEGLPIFPIFLLIVLVNILMIFVIFYFLDEIHCILMNFKWYKKSFDYYLERMQKKVDKFEKKHAESGFLALALLVAVPLPGTGAYSGCLLSWILGLDRKKSIIAISIGVGIAGLIILFGSLGFLALF